MLLYGLCLPAKTQGETIKTLNDVLAYFREEASSNRDLGDRFERLICRYFEIDPIFSEHFSNVWLFNNWPQKGKVGDIGIDIVAEERATGEFCGIQCKFYLPHYSVAKGDIDSFFTALGHPLFTSGMIVSTTDLWGKNAEHAITYQTKPVTRLSIHDLQESPVDWSKFHPKRPQDITRLAKKTPYKHQLEAISDVTAGLAEVDRGKLIMACGTGKTFTSLKIAEQIAPEGNILFLVPSLSLLSQSLREWSNEATHKLNPMAVCSDVNVGQRVTNSDEGGDIKHCDLVFPATTSADHLVSQYDALVKRSQKNNSTPGMSVVFATYHSIDVIAQAQKSGLPEFDLVICDEAHRTTGVTLSGNDESYFVRVHDADYIKAAKRLYMTATPRVYGDDARSKAKYADALLCSMDDTAIYGEELHRLGFGKAVAQNLLSDYKVLVLAVDESYVSSAFQAELADADNELNLDDAIRITGCWNGLAKRFDAVSATPADISSDAPHMRRAVAFSRSIKDSKAFVAKFSEIVAIHRTTQSERERLLNCELDHVDGTHNALERNSRLDWLKADLPPDTCRILSNARCLSEGVDVPALDAVMFLNPRKSVVDIVQAVGRVMRRSPGKRYGYIILPIGVPTNMPADEALRNNEKYKVVWQVLQALRAHDDRFNATINQIELNKRRPDQIQVIGIGQPEDTTGLYDSDQPATPHPLQSVFEFPQLEIWKDAIFARIVLKCGDRRYWESWAKDVALIAERHTARIHQLIAKGEPHHKAAFADFLTGLRENINPSISQDDAVEMLSQHLITRPVFDALFENYAFTQHNPVSQAMQSMLESLQDQALEKETTALEKFYTSVRERAAGIDNAEGRQRVVIELYDKFFRTAFPRMAERLGIVYTPVEVVDFIIHSVEDVLQQEFSSSLSNRDVHIIDPFTGTGTFIVRLLQSGVIKPSDLQHKYQHELHANEIVLLAYYIAAINIEETFHGLQASHAKTRESTADYLPFDGIVLTDTFQLSENKDTFEEKMFPENNRRVTRQKQSPIRVVIGNPPYSAKIEGGSEELSKIKYPTIDNKISKTYAARTDATNKNNLYDSYIRAIRWASDRINGKGVVAFVTNGSFIDGNAMDGLRACLADEFSTIYVFNLRGNARTSGEQRRMERGNVFGEGTRTPVAISLLIKNPEHKGTCKLLYHDIGDYLSRDNKLAIISNFKSLAGIQTAKKWQQIKPNESHDWINQRDPAFEEFIVLGDKKNNDTSRVFDNYSGGLKTSRDAWCYNFNRLKVESNIEGMIYFYNEQSSSFSEANLNTNKDRNIDTVKSFVSSDTTKISWSRGLVNDLMKGILHTYDVKNVRGAAYRPFCKQWVYFERSMNDMIYLLPQVYPSAKHVNFIISVPGASNNKDFSCLMYNTLPDLNVNDGGGQCFPLYLYEKIEECKDDLFAEQRSEELVDGYRRRSAITDEILEQFRQAYGGDVGKEDIFYYVYGVLHSPEYRRRFSADLKKMLPRLPLTKESKDFWRFSEAGRELAEWHLNYESVEPYPVVEYSNELLKDPESDYLVEKMVFGRPTAAQKAAGDKHDKTTLIYNSRITLMEIPLEAYEYVVNGKPALEWLMDRYQVTVDKASGIRNDPNDWAREHNQPRYILDLFKRLIRVSLETNRIVATLPALNER